MKNNKNIKIGIIGLGYVGLPLALEFSQLYKTVGFDKSKTRIYELKKGFDKTLEVSSKNLLESNIELTVSLKDIKDCNVYIITVPTPLDELKKPDLGSLSSASMMIGKLIKKNDIIIYESTVYPGATEEYCVPILEKNSDLIYNKDFFCGYSPERINPGDKKYTLKNIIKITSGSNKEVSKFIDDLYKTIISAGTYRAPSIAIAEAAKVIENTQRDVNISLMNELAIIFNKLNLDTSEILKAASTKWNFLPFKPGLVGGHCIGVDPYYLTYKALKVGYKPEVILAGRKINDGMGKYFSKKIISEMKLNGIELEKSKIAIFGLTFKENCPDLRNSKVLDIIENLKHYNCKLYITDPIADKKNAKDLYKLNIVKLKEIYQMDIVILAVAHDRYKLINLNKWQNFIKNKGIIFDIKSVYSKDYFINTKIKHIRT